MVKKCFLTVVSLALAGFLFPAGAETDLEKPEITFSGYYGLETYEIMSGRFFDKGMFEHLWGGNSIGQLTVNAKLSDRTKFLLTLHGQWWLGCFPIETSTAYKYGLENYSAFFLHQAQGVVSLVEGDNRSLELSFGIIPYKYNPEVRNLGEYLFRSICYPGVVWNIFDFPAERLTGLRLNYRQQLGPGNLNADALVLAERTFRPFGDISVAGVASYNLLKALDFGFGANLYRVLPVNSRLTTPTKNASSKSLYSVDNPIYDGTGAITGYQDSLFYTFSGIKLMARATVDPLFFMRDSYIGKIIGEGGKIYGEVDVIGLKKYGKNDTVRFLDPRSNTEQIILTGGMNKYGYDTLLNKMPLTLGVNIPVPFLLDVCAFECEYYRMRYCNSYATVFEEGLPVPSRPYMDETHQFHVPPNAYSVSDNWKWSVYMKKNLTRHIHLVAQAARDHQRWAVPAVQWYYISDWDDVALRPFQWIWNVKAEVVF